MTLEEILDWDVNGLRDLSWTSKIEVGKNLAFVISPTLKVLGVGSGKAPKWF